MRGHIWTALLNPIDRRPTPPIFFRTSLLRPSFYPKPLHYLFHSPLILISMLLLISGDIHPNPGPIDPCSLCSRRVTWGNRSIQCTNCSLWVHLSGTGLSPAEFVKSPRDTLGPAQCAHPLLNPSPPSHTLILYLHPSLSLHPLTPQIPHLHSHPKSPTSTHKQSQNHIFKN